MITVLQRLRSSSAQPTAAGGMSAAETRYTQNSSRLPVGGLPANGAMIAITICTMQQQLEQRQRADAEVARAPAGEPQHDAQQSGRDGDDDLRRS